MPLIKNGAFEDDKWVAVDDDSDLPADKPVILSLARWQAERETLVGRNAPVAVKLQSSEAPDALQADLDRLAMIALDFPAFKDGRGYSYARILREHFGFEGEIRATGEVLRDQWLAMTRCGVDAFIVADNVTLEAFNEAVNELSLVYQPTGDGRKTVMQLRHGN
ncbi:MAG: DUF934 domain-containing protein [Alphaproteobacteria bacterium]|nr:oxidoreductase [Rhodobiaceae bacterium]MBO6543384.1 DUF934 domain-containing protein [Alphaproteobacteria bacterium]MBO6627544.1 DUF934 domain-containing protein [Alphaproteobacteria bacterium]MDF1627187.1 DUF934 domain-containing protein [Parvibaculaceae bacterium]